MTDTKYRVIYGTVPASGMNDETCPDADLIDISTMDVYDTPYMADAYEHLVQHLADMADLVNYNPDRMDVPWFGQVDLTCYPGTVVEWGLHNTTTGTYILVALTER